LPEAQPSAYRMTRHGGWRGPTSCSCQVALRSSSNHLEASLLPSYYSSPPILNRPPTRERDFHLYPSPDRVYCKGSSVILDGNDRTKTYEPSFVSDQRSECFET